MGIIIPVRMMRNSVIVNELHTGVRENSTVVSIYPYKYPLPPCGDGRINCVNAY